MHHSNFKRAVIYMALYATIQSIVWGMVRHLGEDLSTSTLFFFRNLIGFLTIIPLISKTGLKVFHTKHIKLHLLGAWVVQRRRGDIRRSALLLS